MALYKILHGNVKTAAGLFGAGVKDTDGNDMSVIELKEAEAKQLDPDGSCFQLKSKWDIEQKGEAAKHKAIAEAEAELSKVDPKKAVLK